MKVNFVSPADVERMLLELAEEDRGKVLGSVLAKMNAEERTRVMGLADTGFTVVAGSFVALNSEFVINVQNSSAGSTQSPVDLVALTQAMLEFKRSQQQK